MVDRIAILISYDTKTNKFESLYERNKFYRGLFGFNQRVKKKNKIYDYRTEGLFDRIPHIKVEDSVFIIAEKYIREMEQYFNEWGNKVKFNTFRVLLGDKRWREINVE